MFKNRRLGWISVDAAVVQDSPEVVRKLMSLVIVVHCEMIYAKAAFVYTCLCDDFDEVPEGENPPEYNVEVEETDGDLSFSFSKVE